MHPRMIKSPISNFSVKRGSFSFLMIVFYIISKQLLQQISSRANEQWWHEWQNMGDDLTNQGNESVVNDHDQTNQQAQYHQHFTTTFKMSKNRPEWTAKQGNLTKQLRSFMHVFDGCWILLFSSSRMCCTVESKAGCIIRQCDFDCLPKTKYNGQRLCSIDPHWSLLFNYSWEAGSYWSVWCLFICYAKHNK